MGLLTEGEPLSWEDTKKYADHVRKHGVTQFVRLYRKLEDRKGDVLKWGDEVEYNLVKLDPDKNEAKLILKAHPLLQVLQERQNSGEKGLDATWHPEFGAYMVEGTPGKYAPFIWPNRAKSLKIYLQTWVWRTFLCFISILLSATEASEN